MLLAFFTLTLLVFICMLVLMLEVQKGRNGVVDTCIYDNFSHTHLSQQPPDQKGSSENALAVQSFII